MGKEALTYEDLVRIVDLLKSSSHFSEFHLRVGDIELDMKRGGAGGAAASPRASDAGAGEPAAEPGRETPGTQATLSRGAPAVYPERSILLRSPMVGTFYRAPQPGARPFVDIGQAVGPDTMVCIIEVMKLMNSISAPAKGVITHIPVEDGATVEYGQVLMVIAPE